MSAQRIDGKEYASTLRTTVALATAALKTTHGITPGLAVVLVGNDPASAVYVKSKRRACEEAGIHSVETLLPDTVSQAELLREIERLNTDPAIHGILVQLPLPETIDTQSVINTIDPRKDVDGFHVINAGRLAVGQKGLVPCTPLGCLLLLKHTLGDLAGKHAVILGRSNIVGKPMAQLLLKESCTVTLCHSRTEMLSQEVRRGDIVIAAIGKPNYVKGAWIKPGATIIDVGINRVVDAFEGTSKLVGDVDFKGARELAKYITPVPGGVGPMTIACLLRNTVEAACMINNLPFSFA